MVEPHGALGPSSAPAALADDDDGEDFAVEVTSLDAVPVRIWDRLQMGAGWGRLATSAWVSASVAAAVRARDRLPLGSWIAAYAAAVRVWRRLIADSWVLAYYALAVRVWCGLAISSVRVSGRRTISTWMAACARVPVVRAWDYRLSRREKLRRGAVIAVSLLMALAVIFGPGIAGGIVASRSGDLAIQDNVPDVANAAAAPQLGAWGSVPVPIASNQPVAYTPAPADPSTIYACGAGSALHDSGFVPGNLQVWRTHDAGATWQALSVPRFLANQCDLRIAATAPTRLTLLAIAKGCQSYAAFVSDDGGDNWTSLTLPYDSDALSDIRQCDFIATARHLYLWYSYGLQSSASNDRSVLLRSDDDGRSWKPASPGLPSTAFCNIAISTPATADDDAVLASCPSPAGSGAGSTSVLRQSTDSGQHWHTLGPLPATGASILFTPASSTPLGQLASSPLYVAYTLPGNGSLSGLRLIQTLDGQHWQPLPPLPVAGTSPGLLGFRSVLGTTTDGRLFVLGVDPGAGVTSASSPVAGAAPADRWVWMWDPSENQWSVLSSALPELPSFTCPDICWLVQVSWGAAVGGTRMGPYIWAGTLPYNGSMLLRVFLPAAQSTRVTRVGGGGSSR